MIITRNEKLQTRKVLTSRSDKIPLYHNDVCKVTIIRFLGIPIYRSIELVENARGPGRLYCSSIRL